MRKIRVLVVDDAVVVRKILSDALSSDPGIEVVGVAANGNIALSRINQLSPDLVTLDMEMPEKDGLETLRDIRALYKDLPVIMFSTLTEKGAVATLDALTLGASDYVTKPSNVGSVTLAIQRVKEDLIPKIHALCRHIAVPAPAAAPSAVATARRETAPPPPPKRPAGPRRIDVVAIGSSTGGPNALADVMPAFPADFPVPVVITQHMPPVFTRLLADRLNTLCPLTVREAEAEGAVEAGTVWLAPGDFHMVVVRHGQKTTLSLTQEPPENSCRPAVDRMLRSVHEVYGGNVLAVILTGMGQDGLRGCQTLYDAGAAIFAQDEASSVVWGMPGFIARNGLAEKILPLDQIGPEIVRRVLTGRNRAQH